MKNQQTDLLTPNGARETVSRASGEQIRIFQRKDGKGRRERKVLGAAKVGRVLRALTGFRLSPVFQLYRTGNSEYAKQGIRVRR